MAATIEAVSGFAHLTDLPCLRLSLGQATAVISLYGAHLLSYQPNGSTELLYLSPQAQWKNGSAIRGGVPVCWPWFGPAAPEFGQHGSPLPNHGLVRNELWQLAHQQADARQVLVRLAVQLPAQFGFTHALTVSLTCCLTQEGLQLTLEAPSMLQQAALHSYFKVQQLSQVAVSPLQGRYHDKVLNQDASQQQKALTFDRETDRIYHNTAPELTVTTGRYQLQLNQQGQDASVLWNPWQDKAAKLNDLPDEGYLDFVCVETARLDLTDQTPLQLVQHIRYLGQLE